jgi:hypothetical protein
MTLNWLVPWDSVSDSPGQVAAMERELRREVAEGHPLYNLPVRTLGRRQDCDDVLYAIEDGSGRVAVVHLTWTHSPPDRLPWPVAIVYPSLEVWIVDGMQADHDGFHASA